MDIALPRKNRKRSYKQINDQEDLFGSKLPVEVLAKILSYVDDVWIKIKVCKRVNKKCRQALKMKEAWCLNSIVVKLIQDVSNQAITTAIELNGKYFDSLKRLEAIEKLLQNFPSIKRLEYDGTRKNDLRFLKAIFKRILLKVPVKLKHLSFAITDISQTEQLPKFLESCYLNLESFSIILDGDRVKPNVPILGPTDVDHIWHVLMLCANLKQCSIYKGGQVVIKQDVMTNCISQMQQLTTLKLLGNMGGNFKEIIDVLNYLPNLQSFSIKCDFLHFLEEFIRRPNIVLNLKELHFSDYPIRTMDMNVFMLATLQLPNLTNLSLPGYNPFPIIKYLFDFANENVHHLLEFNWLSEMSVEQLSYLFEQLVLDEDIYVLAIQSVKSILGVQSPSQTIPRPVFGLVKKIQVNEDDFKIILMKFSLIGSWYLKCL